MVVTYLERIREKFQEEQININTQLSIANIQLRENVEIIKFLESNVDRNFEAFTPRQVDGFNIRKIDELKEEQIEINDRISMLQTELEITNEELEKITEVIKVAKENDKIIKEIKG